MENCHSVQTTKWIGNLKCKYACQESQNHWLQGKSWINTLKMLYKYKIGKLENTTGR